MRAGLYVPLLLTILSVGAAGADSPAEKAGETKKLKVFILSGQSNMAGYGDSLKLPEELRKGNDRVLMFEDGKWQPLRPFKPTSQRMKDRQGMMEYSFGPEISFGHEIAKAWPDETIGIVKDAWPATGILAWHPNWSREQAERTGDGSKGPLFKAMIEKVRQACESADCEIMGFVWMQGAADMKEEATAKEYLANLKALVEGIRKETGVPDLPLILGSYRPGGMPDDLSGVDPADYPDLRRPGALEVLQAQYDAQKELAPATMVPLRDLETHPNNQHFNTAGQLGLGRLFARAYLELVHGKTDLQRKAGANE